MGHILTSIDGSTSRSADVTNMAVFWSKRAPKSIVVNGSHMEFFCYFSMYR